MGNKICKKCGSTLTNIEYKSGGIWSKKEWLEFTCISCRYVWKEPTFDREKSDDKRTT